MAQKSSAHGFVWPAGLPKCVMCGRDANDKVHVTPSRGGLASAVSSSMLLRAADRSTPNMPMQAHGFMLQSPSALNGVTCQACGQSLDNGIHAIGLPSGAVPVSSNSGLYGSGLTATLADQLPGAEGGQDGYYNGHPIVEHTFEALPGQEGVDPDYQMCAHCGFTRKDGAKHAAAGKLAKQSAFVAEIGHRLIFAAPVTMEFQEAQLPREVASAWQAAQSANPYYQWIAGRYVEADRPNRNSAYWSTADLELGQPTVKHGPINWLHEEKHIIGAIAGSEMVHVGREAAAATGVGNHIVMLGAIWSHIYPQEANVIARASENGKLWASMECVSQQVACLSCENKLTYEQYMRHDARCEHMRSGMPRRFVDPTFGGAGIIVPPVRPGWANADMRVMGRDLPRASALAEAQAAAFEGMTTTEAEMVVAQILESVAK